MKTRRKFLLGAFGILGSTALGGWLFRGPLLRQYLIREIDFDATLMTAAPASGETPCVLTTTTTEGPFFVPSPLRADVREDREGVDLDFKLQLVNHTDCSPIPGANVEIWHCDAEGRYSGYPEEMAHDLWAAEMYLRDNVDPDYGELHVNPSTEARYLRGRQISDADGWVNFQTVFPGWYNDRVPHIHVKAFLPSGQQIGTQFCFTDEFCDELYTTEPPYTRYGKQDFRFEDDIALALTGDGKGIILTVNKKTKDDYAGGLWATARMGIKMA